jgi:hypothetical protein
MVLFNQERVPIKPNLHKKDAKGGGTAVTLTTEERR